MAPEPRSALPAGGPSEPTPESGHSSLLSRARLLARAVSSPAQAAGGPPTALEHAEGTAAILEDLGADETALAAAFLIQPADRWPVQQVARDLDPVLAHVIERMRQLMRLQAAAEAQAGTRSGEASGIQPEMLRRMLLAMSDDIRIVLLLLADRLETLRAHARGRSSPDTRLCRETLEVFAPLANRLGLWQIKWEMEDLAFRFLEPAIYRELAGQLEHKREQREVFVEQARNQLEEALEGAGIAARLSGRPKHLYSIHVKMKAKARGLDGIQDLRGLRVIVSSIDHCYGALDVVHSLWRAVESEYDDYIAKPKPNGYRSLHTVVVAEDGFPLEVQIRTEAMHRFAEYGVASHWRYKEGRATGPGAASVEAERNIDWVRQLLAWQREMDQSHSEVQPASAPRGSTYVYVLTPQARVIELPAGSTAVDFAYHVHTGLGHRCRGARVDGQLVPLNRPLQTGQTVEIISAKDSGAEGPSRDWLNASLGYVASHRARGKVRQWFNALELERDAASGRERVERLLQREGKTALSFDELARRLGQNDVLSLFVAVAREEIGLRQIEEALRVSVGVAVAPDEDEQAPLQRLVRPVSESKSQRAGSVLVVGLDSLMNQLARCCRPLPPDPVAGFITRGRGVTVHRRDCTTYRRLIVQSPERGIDTSWEPSVLQARAAAGAERRYPAEVELRAHDRQGLLRDVSEVFARDRMNVTAVNTLSRNQQALMRFTVEAGDASQLERTLVALRKVNGVLEARRR